jgi:hypothetical protein
VTNTAQFIQDLTSLLEAIVGDVSRPNEEPAPNIVGNLTAELTARLRSDDPNRSPETNTGDRIAMLAAYLDGGLDVSTRRQVEALLAASPAELQDAMACLVDLDDVESRRASAPVDLVDAAIAAWRAGRTAVPRQADIITLRGENRRGSLTAKPPAQGGSAPDFDSFQLLAAASGSGHQAILCRSQSGLWTLEVFVGKSERDQRAEQGYLLLTVHPDHRATYEGRIARVFVTVGHAERVLAEQPVRDGEVYATISLVGLDLWTKDAVNVVFGPTQRRPDEPTA